MDPLLKIALPAVPESTRGNLDDALASRIGPLFGIYDPNSPHGRSWVVDVRRVLLKELAQGMPDPRKDEWRKTDPRRISLEARATSGTSAATVPDSSTDSRKPKRPPALAPTTVNKFGPDVRGALVLSAVNQLLAEHTEALWELMEFDLQATRNAANRDPLHDPDCPFLSRSLTLWAAAISELWTSYPTLLWAGLWGRNVQRAGNFDVRLAPDMAPKSAPSEYGSAEGKPDEYAPVRLEIIDGLIDRLRTATYRDKSPFVSRSDAQWLEDAAENLIEVLGTVAQPDGDQPGIVWVPELPLAAERITTAYVIPFQIVREFARRLEPHIQPAKIADSWAWWETFFESVWKQAGERSPDSLSTTALALYVRAVDVTLEWLSRGEVAGSKRLTPAKHAALQKGVLAMAHDLAARPDGAHFDGILFFAELRATACELRLAKANNDSEGLRSTAETLADQLDNLLRHIRVRRLPTGPALAQLSRATTDLFDALRFAADPDDAFWSAIHHKVGGYWEQYQRFQSEGIQRDGFDGAVSHYMGNRAGYYADIDVAPRGSDTSFMLSEALDLYQRRIIPYRAARALRRADWEDSLFDAYNRASKCALELSRRSLLDGDEASAATRVSWALEWLAAAKNDLTAFDELSAVARKKWPDSIILFNLLDQWDALDPQPALPTTELPERMRRAVAELTWTRERPRKEVAGNATARTT